MSDLIMLVDKHHYTSGSQKCYKVTFTCETSFNYFDQSSLYQNSINVYQKTLFIWGYHRPVVEYTVTHSSYMTSFI